MRAHRPFALVLSDFVAHWPTDAQVSLADLIAKLRLRGFGALLVLFGLVAMLPVPGPNAILALPLFIIAVQMMCGYTIFRLPNWLGRRQMRAQILQQVVHRFTPFLLRCEALSARRWLYMVPIKQWRAQGAMVLLAACAIALPLPLPGSNSLPALSVVLIGLGVVWRDGALVLFGNIAAGFASGAVMSIFVWLLWRGQELLF